MTLGPSDGEQVAVTKGLEPGQVIVTDGADRLKDGAKIQVVQPAAQAPGQPGQSPPQGAETASGTGAAAPEQRRVRARVPALTRGIV